LDGRIHPIRVPAESQQSNVGIPAGRASACDTIAGRRGMQTRGNIPHNGES
jgi:hypothetical protein